MGYREHEAREIRFVGPSAFAPRLVRAPRLRWRELTGVAEYEVAVADQERVVWKTRTPAAEVDLSPAWPLLGLGPVDVLVRGFDDSGHEVTVRNENNGTKRLWKVADFDGVLQEPGDWESSIHRAVEYLLAPARDEVYEYEGSSPRSIWSSHEETVTGLRYQLGFPSLHNPSFILALLTYAQRFPESHLAQRAESQAIQYGDWLVEHTLPAGWRCAGLSPSTVENGRVGGFIEGGNITLFRAARVGEAMVRLRLHTGQEKYLAMARRIGDVLIDLQNADGSWPYRVDPKTGATVEEYTSAVITPIRLLALLEPFVGDDVARLRDARLRAEKWLVDGPITNGRWEGMYEDVPSKEPWANLQNWDTCETIRYLLSPDCTIPGRVQHAEALNAYIEDQFVVWAPEVAPVQVHCPTPSVLEQYHCFFPMEVHTGNWLASLLALHRVTGKSEYWAKGIAAANSIVAGQHDHGALSTWGFDTRFGMPLSVTNWPGCNAVAVSALLHWSSYFSAPAAFEPSPWSI